MAEACMHLPTCNTKRMFVRVVETAMHEMRFVESYVQLSSRNACNTGILSHNMCSTAL